MTIYAEDYWDAKEQTFTIKEVILISEYVRVGHQSTPKAKTIDLINEYLRIKNEKTNRHTRRNG